MLKSPPMKSTLCRCMCALNGGEERQRQRQRDRQTHLFPPLPLVTLPPTSTPQHKNDCAAGSDTEWMYELKMEASLLSVSKGSISWKCCSRQSSRSDLHVQSIWRSDRKIDNLFTEVLQPPHHQEAFRFRANHCWHKCDTCTKQFITVERLLLPPPFPTPIEVENFQSRQQEVEGSDYVQLLR